MCNSKYKTLYNINKSIALHQTRTRRVQNLYYFQSASTVYFIMQDKHDRGENILILPLASKIAINLISSLIECKIRSWTISEMPILIPLMVETPSYFDYRVNPPLDIFSFTQVYTRERRGWWERGTEIFVVVLL